MTETKQKKKSKSFLQNGSNTHPPSEAPLLSILTKIRPFLRRYGLDILAIVLIAWAILTLFSLIGWTSGSFIDRWQVFLERYFGSGSFVFVLLFLVFAFWIFRRRVFGLKDIQLRKIIYFEIAYFALIAYFAIHSSLSLDRIGRGVNGGIIGWGIADLLLRFLPLPVVSVILVLVFVLFLTAATGFFGWLGKQFDQWLALYAAENPQAISLEELAEQGSAPEGMISPLKKRGKKTQQRPQSQLVITPAASLNRDQTLPPLSLLDKEQLIVMDDVLVEKMGAQIENTLEEFGIPARVAGYRIGPTVTQFAIEPGFVERVGTDGEISKHKVRVSQISSLAKDLALALSAERLRIEAPVPGQSYVGIEVPNPQSKMVRLRPILESEAMQRINSKLALALGQDVSGQAVVADLSKMPHVLIAGTTGSGKSVCVSAITACLLMNNSPQDLRIAMLDPKMVELVRFNGVPHLLGKVETSIDRMVGVMHWAIAEMDQRYRLLEDAKARDLDAYNFKMGRKNQPTLPRIVLIIDELADLMMSSPDQIEHGLVRLAQMARAVGIHLVVATQRPSTDVVTGLIKANFPARIAFTVASSIDSRVILDTSGAETLMGKGDMLYLAPDVGAPQRAQGVMVSDQEIDKIIKYWQNFGIEDSSAEAPWEELMKVMDDDTDDLVKQAIDLVKKSQRASASMLQRRLRIGFPRAARLLDELEEMGIVGPSQGGGKDREVMIDADDDWEDIETEEND
ncbi:MAG: hypothetical protein CL609_21210 [Anaerolineaceae bacterium]|nr:hypothetical protein [Anaerolineaceae bacterium]